MILVAFSGLWWAGCDRADPVQPPEATPPVVTLRRLTVHEIDGALRDVLLDDSRPTRDWLPPDRAQPFDNDYTTQNPSLALVEGAEALATRVAGDLVADAERWAALVPCEPRDAMDEVCLRAAIASLGRLLWRRPLDAEDLAALTEVAQIYAAEAGAFEAGLEVAVRALLQDPAFLYRVEQGTPVADQPGVYRLDGYEVATRLALLLWGSVPDSALLDAAAAGELETPQGVRAHAERLLADARARDQVDRFHAQWLGYDTLPHAPWLTEAMRDESRALVERVVFDDQRAWLELFTSEQSWLSADLAAHYGVAGPGGAGPEWVTTDVGRRGILGTGSFLSVASGVADTSPTRRGKLVRERLFCNPVPPPPPGVDADAPPAVELGACKEDRYAQHRDDPACADCHKAMDPIGFGLENYDREGVWRTHDDGAPECTIRGEGEVDPIGSFHGPAELGALAAEADIDVCAVLHVMQAAMGREPGPDDEALVAELLAAFRSPVQGTAHRFDQLLLELVAHPTFSMRKEASP